MDQLAFSLCFDQPPLASGDTVSSSMPPSSVRSSFHHPASQALTTPPSPDEALMKQFKAMCEHVQQTYGVTAHLCSSDNFAVRGRVMETPPDFNVTLYGNHRAVLAARGYLLCANPIKARTIIKATRSEVLATDGEVKQSVKSGLDEIARDTGASVSLFSGQTGRGGSTRSSSARISPLVPLSTGSSEKSIDIVISGSWEAIEVARIRILILLDELQNLKVDQVDIDLKLHNLICGRKRCHLETIMQETATNIYFPSPLTSLTSLKSTLSEESETVIYLTGDPTGIQRAKDMLFKLATQKTKCMYSKDTTMIPRKIDFLLTHRREELKKIMYDNGAFIQFPALGSQGSVLTVFGENRVNVERAIRMVMQLACQLYHAQFWVFPAATAPPTPGFQPMTYSQPQVSQTPFAHPQVLNLVSQMAQVTGAEVAFKGHCFEVFGSERAVRNAYQRITEMDIIQAYHQETKFQVELANEHQDFISGKKNGKINKIMKTTGVRITFVHLNEYNFLIDVTSSNFTKALDGLSMLQEELPAEISFHVPEAYHKRIIGVGGKNIQRIMKKYGVYVKFSNAEEFAALGGYFDNNDNVIARTPAKNGLNLDNLKHAVLELVGPKDRELIEQPVNIPRRHHRMLLAEKSAFLHDIEEKTGCRFHFSFKETGSDTIVVRGYQSQVMVAVQLLLELVPQEIEFHVPLSPALKLALGSVDFRNRVIDRARREYNVIIETPPPSSVPSSASSSPVATTPLGLVDATGEESQSPPLSRKDYAFIIRFTRGNADLLPTTIELLTSFLSENHVPLYPETQDIRSDSFVESLPHFNSRLLSSVTSAPESPSVTSLTQAFQNYRLFDGNMIESWKSQIRDSTTFSSSSSSPPVQMLPYLQHRASFGNIRQPTEVEVRRSSTVPSLTSVAESMHGNLKSRTRTVSMGAEIGDFGDATSGQRFPAQENFIASDSLANLSAYDREGATKEGKGGPDSRFLLNPLYPFTSIKSGLSESNSYGPSPPAPPQQQVPMSEGVHKPLRPQGALFGSQQSIHRPTQQHILPGPPGFRQKSLGGDIAKPEEQEGHSIVYQSDTNVPTESASEKSGGSLGSQDQITFGGGRSFGGDNTGGSLEESRYLQTIGGHYGSTPPDASRMDQPTGCGPAAHQAQQVVSGFQAMRNNRTPGFDI
ncbi:uncharacterized protein VTP21DRAFT_5917 [Calcarisporiella thermophila]|uniref:uncharacterized protein n=1 Tax=Calcarisporiella thermophila TaxID=911321 RepID=UPI0037440567